MPAQLLALATAATLTLPTGARIALDPARLGLTLHDRGATLSLATPGAAEPGPPSR